MTQSVDGGAPSEDAAAAGDTTAAGMTGPAAAPSGPPPPGPMAKTGVPYAVTPRATWLLAPNPGPMTFDGTNSWVLHEPGQTGAVIVDPGPGDTGHLTALVALAHELGGGRVDAILLSHGHPDHSEGARETARLTGAPVLAADAHWGDRVITPGPLEVSPVRIEMVPTPGHSSDSVCYLLPDDHSMLTGDTVLGRSAPAILDPDGRVDQTIDSLQLIARLMDGPDALILPGHGPLVPDPAGVLSFALFAREGRLRQIEDAVREGHDTVGTISDRCYGPFDERIRRVVEATVRAHLRYLQDRDRLAVPVNIDG
jgi:glyoxylase-like metal-dependent hydrolase (beta-lactamase superfamily II)